MFMTKKKIFYYIELAFKISFLFLCLFNFNSFFFGTKVTSVLVTTTVLLAGVCGVYRLINYKHYIRNWILLVLIGFMLSYCITLLLSWKYGYLTPVKTLAWMGMQILLLFATDERKKIEDYKKEVHIIMHVFTAVIFVSSITSFALMFVKYSSITFYEGIRVISGFTWGRLWGVYTDPNYAAVMATVSMLFSFYMLSRKSKWFAKAFYILNIVAQILYICFSDSRTGMVVAFLGLGVYSYCVFVKRFVQQKSVLKNIGCIAMALLVGLGAMVSMSIVKTGYNQIVSFVEEYQSSAPLDPTETEEGNEGNETTEPDKTDDFTVGREEDIQNDISNRRFDLWGSAIETFMERPIFGISFDNIRAFVKDCLPDTYLINNDHGEYSNYHNSLFNILVGQGLVGFVLFMIAAAIAGVKSIKVVYHNIREEHSEFYAMIFSVLVAALASSMFLQEFVYTLSPNTFLFWLLLGILLRGTAKKKEGEKCLM